MYPRPLVIALAALVLAAVTLACDDEPDPIPVPCGPAPTATPKPCGPPLPSPTPPGAAPATTTAPATPAAGRIDGTVAPQNAGATDPITIKANPDPLRGTALLRDVRIGIHPEEGGWDRIVFEFAGNLPPGAVAYVPAVAACGSGAPVTLPGAAILTVRFTQTAAHTAAGQPSVARTTITSPGETIREARQTCDFEGEVAWAIGLTDRRRFKVTLLAQPRRVVIDIKQ